ncbi:hypothetical protein HDU97_004075 [Phlyctochytrium planicorne]|nr:hypothetical protein HDU97_004075 [Phlyctochytrium planicorne]
MPEVKGFFQYSPRAAEALADRDFTRAVTDLMAAFLANSERTQEEKELTLLSIGSIFLLGFMQSCWTGPKLPEVNHLFLPQNADVEELEKAALNYLSIDSEEVYKLTSDILLLVMARAILVDNRSFFSASKLVDWWKLRVVFVQQRILDNPAGSGKEILFAAMESVKGSSAWTEVDEKIRQKAMSMLTLESGLVYSYYGDDEKAKAHYKEAQELTGLKWNVTGALGRRTRFQEFDVAQLIVKAESSSLDEKEAKETPKTLALNDDTLLENIMFTTPKDIDDPALKGNLNPQDQCILLSFCLNVQNENPEDGLTTEQMVPYVTRVLENPNNWTIHTMALLLRSRLEAKKSRTAERAALQLQALVDQIPLEESTVSERLRHIFSLMVPPKWNLERELGERFASLGVLKSALEIFERLQMWDDVVSCMQLLGKDKEAEEVVRKQLETAPGSPKLHCLLGDILKDPQMYYEAWSLSRFKYARAMRSLGAYHFREGDFVESVECYRKGLTINPLFENSWFVMGCAALRAEDWESAEEAFRRTISLDHSNGEAWTNLASVFIRKGKKRDAWRALREALRQHHENSKIWDNYLFICTDLGEFNEAVRALQQILDLRTRHSSTVDINEVIDFEVLQIVINAIVEGLGTAATSSVSAKGQIARLSTLLKSYKEKFSSARLYTICADFSITQESFRDALEDRQKAYRLYLQSPSLTTDEKTFKDAVKHLRLLLTAFSELGDKEEVVNSEGDKTKVCPDWKYQARTTLRTFIGRTKDVYDGTEELEELISLQPQFK